MTSAQFFFAIAFYALGIMQIYCDVNHDYELLSIHKHVLLAEKQRLSQEKVVFNCVFERGWCGLKNEKNKDEFDWTLTNASTPSMGTGPRHDLSGIGSYIFIESSVPRRYGDTSRLTSPVFQPMIYCLQFGFHAFGENIGSLIVHKKSFGNTREMLLRLDKNYGNEWKYVSMTVSHPLPFMIEFEGVCGNGYRGDIALDNISLTAGICETFEQNNANSCGFGYPGFVNKISGLHTYYFWPWILWLSSANRSEYSCSAVQVSANWLLTTRDCLKKLGSDIILYTKNKHERKTVLKIERRNTGNLQSVLLQMNSSTSRKMDKVCLPSNIPLQNRVTECHLLAMGSEESFVETSAIVLSTTSCEKMSLKRNLDLNRQLCIQVNVSSGFNESLQYTGYLTCKNSILKRWILQAMGSFTKVDFIVNNLVLQRVSYDVNWIENITQVLKLSPDAPTDTIPTQPPALAIKGFQIMESRTGKCLTLEPYRQKFTFKMCDVFNMKQRFEWSTTHQLLSLYTNSCVAGDTSHSYTLRIDRCNSRRRSQVWTCKVNAVFNIFINGYISWKSDKTSGFVRLRREREFVGHFVISGTHDNLCSLRRTVEGVFKCDFNRHRMCGFDGVDTHAQFMWRVPRYGSKEYKKYPQLVSTDKFFRVLRRTVRGRPTAVLRSPWFHGQHCAKFYALLHGSSLDQLKIYKGGGGEDKLMFQRNATNDQYWRFLRVTIVPTECEAFQVVFEVVFSDFAKSKVALRDIVISPGACRPRKEPTEGICLQGWKFINGQCMHFHDSKATWHEASAVCKIAGAELATHTVGMSKLIPRGRSVWFGVRSCPTRRFYSVLGVPYSYNNRDNFPTPVCLYAKEPHNGAAIYQTGQCSLKLPFACQKDPRTASNTCGWRNSSSSSDRQWPWHVLIVVYDRCVCGGTLVAPGYVITSTLCLSRVWLRTVKLFFPSSRKVVRRILKIINHPSSGIKSGDNDISVVQYEVDSSLGPSSHFSCLNQPSLRWTDDDNNLLKDKKCVVLGWGTFKGSHRICGPKNYAAHEVILVNRKECGDYYGHHMITERMICAKASNQTSSKCLGDTGGPLVCDIAGTWTLVGVTNWGVGCTFTRRYGVYTDIGSMKPWIDIVTRE